MNCTPRHAAFASRVPLADLDAAFGAFFAPQSQPAPRPRTINPPMSIWTDATTAFVELDVPGFNMQDIELTLQRDVLTIKGKRDRAFPAGAEVVRSERASGEFERSVRLGETIDGEKIAAALNAGVLTITMPRKPEAQPRKINVATSN
ncbi:N/A [soil metagenome]